MSRVRYDRCEVDVSGIDTSEGFETRVNETLMSFLKDISPEEELLETDALRTALELLAELDERESTVLKMRFGLENLETHTLKEIGEELSLTRERVRQIETEALAKLAQGLEDPRDRLLSNFRR